MIRAVLPVLLMAHAAFGSGSPFGLEARRAGGSGYNWDRCDEKEGPYHWAEQFCSGKEQTPIDLCGAKKFSAAPTLMFDSVNWDRANRFKVQATGAGVQINVMDKAPILKTGDLSYLVGRGTQTDSEWKLAQAHFHWGRSANEGSEHFKQGEQFPLEIHFVHHNNKYSSLQDAVASGNSNALLVVGQFYQINPAGTESAALAELGKAAQTATAEGVEMTTPINLNELIDPSDAYYSYRGSLTTPTCNEVVTWVVLETPRTVSKETMDRFWAMAKPSDPSEKISKYGSYRPLQPHNNRVVYHSAHNTAGCATHGVKEPDFACESSKVDWWNARNLVIISSVLGGVLGLAILLIIFLLVRSNQTPAQSGAKEATPYTANVPSGNAYTATATPGAAGMA